MKLKEFNASRRIKDRAYVLNALWDCLIKGDAAGFKDILRTHLSLINKEKICHNAGLTRRTLFRMLSPSGNPTLSNISKLVQALSTSY